MITRLRNAIQAMIDHSPSKVPFLELNAALDEQFNIMVADRDDLRNRLVHMEQALSDIQLLSAQRALDIRKEVLISREASTQKSHSLSNYVMSLSNKIDELAALIQMYHSDNE